MSVLGYDTGPISCQAAFTADFEVARTISIQQVITKMDTDRLKMDVRPGMRSKHVPLRFDPATGAQQIGGRYLFETWEDVTDYARFTTEELEFEPGVRFWDRPIFSRVDRHLWHVAGAHDFEPVETHYVQRFERLSWDTAMSSEAVGSAWPDIRDAAEEQGLASAWLLVQPKECQIGLLTVASKPVEGGDPEQASRVLAALERAQSPSRLLMQRFGSCTLFDRTSLNLSLWLPWSRRLGGDATLFPAFPTHPMP